MNDIQNKVSDSTEVSDLRKQCAALNRHLVMLLLAVLVMSGTLTVFLGVQARRLGLDLKSVRPQAMQVQAASEKETPVINSFMAQLAEYGKTHPDFAPVMNRFRLGAAAAAQAGAAGAPATGAVPAAEPKK